MEYINEKDLGDRIRATLSDSGSESLFTAFDGASQLQAIRRDSSACAVLRLSDYVRGDRSLNPDAFANALDSRGEKTLVLGIGEYAALLGDWTPLDLLWARRRDPRKFIAPIFDGYSKLEQMQQRIAFRPVLPPIVFLAPTRELWSYRQFKVPAKVDCEDMHSLLQKLETGQTGELSVRTRVPLLPERGTTVDSYSHLYMLAHPEENLSQGLLAEEQWQTLLERPDRLDDSFFGPANFLRLHTASPSNPYLRKVIAETDSHADFRRNFIGLLLDCRPDSADFQDLANGRHELADKLTEDDIRDYLFQLEKIPAAERLPYLCPKRPEERREILKYVSMRPELAASSGLENLNAYLADYQLLTDSEETGAALTAHFQAYKKAKLANSAAGLATPAATTRLVNMLPTRSMLVEKQRSPLAKLYWVDALGCEYLAFFQHYARKFGLAMEVEPGRVKLPSITRLNRDFYEDWPHAKEVIRELDDIKHGRGEPHAAADVRNWPLHLMEELDVLENLMRRIKSELMNGGYDKIVVAADHGATRMAVIANDELIWEMPEKGQYGGRCCPAHVISGDLPPNVVPGEDKAWLVVADYARFRGSHQGSVEVHGGASLEEAVVPVITFSLADRLPEIRQAMPEEIRLAPGQKSVDVAIVSDRAIAKPTLRLNGRVYPLAQSGALHYSARVPVAELGEHNEGAVYAGNDKLDPAIAFRISRGVKVNDDFDDLFS